MDVENHQLFAVNQQFSEYESARQQNTVELCKSLSGMARVSTSDGRGRLFETCNRYFCSDAAGVSMWELFFF